MIRNLSSNSQPNAGITRRAALGAVAAGPVTAALPLTMAAAVADAATSLFVSHRTISIDGIDVFYREAGPADAPAVLLLHGFPTSSHMFRHLIPALADQWRVVAPDYPGFGFSAFPARDDFPYTFAAYSELLSRFTEQVGLSRFAIYIQDYGAPVGLRLALRAPERIAALVIQNGNAYAEGLSDGWAPIKAYWSDPTPANRDRLRVWLDEPGTRQQYVAGVPDALIERFAPDTWTLDWTLLERPGNIELQVDLFGDYQTNVALYPEFQAYFRAHRPPTLITWGRYDPFFTVAGAKAYLRDLPDAELHLLEAGHFALETHAGEIIPLVRRFLGSLA
jgi:pimeloyl-ACP methyl ester carboxylesterase